jgi:hypothetical protein
VWTACLLLAFWNRTFLTAFVIISAIWFTAIVINDFLLITRLVLNQSLFRQHRTWFAIRWLGNLLMVLLILGSCLLFAFWWVFWKLGELE